MDLEASILAAERPTVMVAVAFPFIGVVSYRLPNLKPKNRQTSTAELGDVAFPSLMK